MPLFIYFDNLVFGLQGNINGGNVVGVLIVEDKQRCVPTDGCDGHGTSLVAVNFSSD